MRAASISLVLLSHLGLSRLIPGAFGVTLFFFISGYLITRQLAAALGREGRIGFAGFYVRRALRLLPAGLTFIAASGLAYLLEGGRLRPAEWAAAFFYGANYYDLWAGFRSAVPGVRHPFNILWSLAVEEHFYLLWPGLLALVWCGWGRAGAGRAALLMGLAVLIWRAWLFSACFGGTSSAPAVCGPANPNPAWAYNRLYLATDARLDSLAWGAALALLQEARGRFWPGAVLLAVSFALPGPEPRFVLRPALQGMGLALLIPLLLHPAGALSRVSRGALSAAPVRLVGRLSYSLYLWHWLALGVADRLAQGDRAAWLCIAIALTATLSAMSYWGVETPLLRLRRRFGSLAPVA